jgi:hypothetical protein
VRAALAGAATCALLAWAGGALAGPCDSPLALSVLALDALDAVPAMAADPAPRLLLAQRSIDREWTTRADSLVNPNYLTGGKSEPAALGLSLLVPGAGQLYVGERSGFAFLAAEVVGIVGVVFLNHKADEYNDNAATIAGVPTDTTSGWSSARWSSATGGDPAALEALYAVDRDAYYDVIGANPGYSAGWSSSADQQEFVSTRDLADNRLHRAHILTSALWINHLASAVDALRAARIYNLPLRENLRIKGNVRWRHGSPDVRIALSGKF